MIKITVSCRYRAVRLLEQNWSVVESIRERGELLGANPTGRTSSAQPMPERSFVPYRVAPCILQVSDQVSPSQRGLPPCPHLSQVLI